MDVSVKYTDVGTEITFHLSDREINFLHLIKDKPCYGVSISPTEIQNLIRYVFIKEAKSNHEIYFPSGSGPFLLPEYMLDWRGETFVGLK